MPTTQPLAGAPNATMPTTSRFPATRKAYTPFVVMAKPTGPICNLRCSYCYYLDKTSIYERPHSFKMSGDTLENYIRSYIEVSPGPAVHFVWHGGEPALAGLAFFRRVVELQQRYLPPGLACWNNLQTNGTLIDKKWADFLSAERFEVGLSVDGTQAAHDANRQNRKGAGSWARATRAARLLIARGLEPDLLCTVNPVTAGDPLGVYNALKDLGSTFIQFLPVVRRPAGSTRPSAGPVRHSGEATHPPTGSVDPAAYGHFLNTIFDEWSAHDLGRVMVQTFGETMRALSGAVPALCTMAPTCGRALVLEHDGSVFSCDHFVDTGHLLGNVNDASLAELADSPAQRVFGNTKSVLPRKCLECPWLAACNGGCPKDRLVESPNGEPPLNYLCEGLKIFFQHSVPVMKRILGGEPVSPQAPPRRPGRNDPCPCGSGKLAKQCCFRL